MSAYDTIEKGLNEALAFAEGQTKGARVHKIEVPSVAVVDIRQH